MLRNAVRELVAGIGWSRRFWAEYNSVMSVDESKFHYTYVPEHLKEKVSNWRNLSFSERFDLTCELCEAAWAKIGVVRDPNKQMDKTLRRVVPSVD
jgi:hypothetical protein